MATAAQSSEPLTREITRQVPNLRNASVAEEYARLRAIINAALDNRHEEVAFWESVQSDEGWV